MLGIGGKGKEGSESNKEKSSDEEEITNDSWNLPLSGAMREFHSQ